MADGKEKRENPEEMSRRERRLQSKRAYYERNKHWMLPEAAERREAARRARKRSRCRTGPDGKVRPPKGLTEAEYELLKAKRRFRRRLTKQFGDLAWIVVKMNLEAKMSQERIFELLGGLASKKEIQAWCARGKELARLEPLL